jgi:hypothetical protein
MNKATNNLVESIVGIWSHDILFSPGAAADEILVFRPDGTGVCEIYNWTLCSYDTFVWSLEHDGKLNIYGRDSFESAMEHSASSLSVSSIPFHITREQTPVYGTVDILNLRLAEWLPKRFGRTKGDIASYTLPEFDRNA